LVQHDDEVDAATGRMRPGEKEIHVLEENWEGLMVFQCCQMAITSGMNGIKWLGVSALEVRAALELRGIPRKRWPELHDVIRDFSSHVAGFRNATAASEGRAK